MKLYLLKQRGVAEYGEVDGFVVAATNSIEARNLAASRAGSEGQSTWQQPNSSTCSKIGNAAVKCTEPTIFMRDFL